MSENEAGGRNLKVLLQGFQIVELVSEQPGLTLTSLATELDLPKSTAHIYLQTLEQAGYLINTDNGYEVSFKFLNIGGRRRSRFHLYEVAQTPMTELAGDIDDTLNVGLGIEERGQRILLNKVEGMKSPFADVPLGHATNLHWVAQGKALLSKFSPERVDAIIDQHGLPAATEQTITNRDDLFDELESTRDQGYSLENEERVEGIRAIGVPMEGKASDPYGVVAISGPKFRLGDEQISSLVAKLNTTANIIEIEYKNY